MAAGGRQQQQQQQYQQQQSNPNLPIVLPKPPTRPIGTITASAPPLEDDDYAYESNTRMNSNTNSANQLPKPPDILPSQPNYQSSSISSVSGASNDGLEPYPSLAPIGSNDSNSNTNKDQNQKDQNGNVDYGIYSMSF
ncbi:MAG: hypothetical protein EZS28_037231 [Streblomastix strix]|uniref:Uncharacterized protein n=1 Tax=Streblomastix strix TaxID=222440 RepID=A0A5J4UAQ8_9EUKA|nr:MAG: hypothetical protein EZS28_037231 [Streblomastix strix]